MHACYKFIMNAMNQYLNLILYILSSQQAALFAIDMLFEKEYQKVPIFVSEYEK
jgi:hypothetical protein